MNIQFKRTDSSDSDFKNLIVRLDQELWSRYPETQQHFAPFNNTQQTMKVIVAYWNDEAAGCGCFKPFSKDGSVEIKRMFVDPSKRGHRIGASVLSELEKWASEEGYTTAVLETGINQPEAITVYERAGYKRIPNYPPYEAMTESICMAKEIR